MKTVFEALDRRLDPGATAPLAVALSGGGDSLALLILALQWARTHGRSVLALGVDHGLNPDSGRWTAEAGAAATRLGADWRALCWEGPKPTTGLPAKARAARHSLLAQAARTAGARVILMGHTADDVAEGEVMRVADAPGLGRLREWAPSPAWPEGRGVFLHRPLLAVSRAELRALLMGRGETWLDDPANQDSRYARVRARRHLTSAYPRGSGDPGFFVRSEPAARAAKAWVPASAGMSGVEGVRFARNVEFGEGQASFGRPSTEGEGAKSALSALLLCISGTTRPPRRAELDRLIAAITEGRTSALAGCRASVDGDRVIVERAPPRRGIDPRPIEPSHWVKQRFHAACGLYESEAAIPSTSSCDGRSGAL